MEGDAENAFNTCKEQKTLCVRISTSESSSHSFQHHLSIIQCHASNYKPPKPLSPRMPCINFPELNRKIIITMQKIKKIKLKNAFSQCNSMQIHASIMSKRKNPTCKDIITIRCTSK